MAETQPKSVQSPLPADTKFVFGFAANMMCVKPPCWFFFPHVPTVLTVSEGEQRVDLKQMSAATFVGTLDEFMAFLRRSLVGSLNVYDAEELEALKEADTWIKDANVPSGACISMGGKSVIHAFPLVEAEYARRNGMTEADPAFEAFQEGLASVKAKFAEQDRAAAEAKEKKGD